MSKEVKCTLNFDDLPDNAVITLGKVIYGQVTYDGRMEENSRPEISIRKQTVAEVKKIIADKENPEVVIDVIIFQ